MKNRLNALKNKILKIASNCRNWTRNNWIKYTYLKLIFFVLCFPFLILMATVGSLFAIPSVILFAFGLAVIFFLDSTRVELAQKNPRVFVSVEKIEQNILYLFLIAYGLMFLVLIFFLNEFQGGIVSNNPLFLFVLSFWTGILLNFELNMIEYSPVFTKIVKKYVKKKHQHWFLFYPSERKRIKARFCLVSNLLSNNPTKIEIHNNFSYFLKGIKMYNDLLKRHYKFIITDPKKFYCYAKLTTLQKNGKSFIKNKIDSLAEFMELEDDDPFEFVKLLNEMTGEPTDSKSLFKEIEVEPKMLRRWFSVNSDSLKLILAIISPILSIALAFLAK